VLQTRATRDRARGVLFWRSTVRLVHVAAQRPAAGWNSWPGICFAGQAARRL